MSESTPESPDFLALGLELISWKPSPAGKLLGFAAIRFPLLALNIRECPVVVNDNRQPQVVLPSKAVLDYEGQTRRDENGKVLRERLLTFDTSAISRDLSRAVVRLIREAHPGALDEGWRRALHAAPRRPYGHKSERPAVPGGPFQDFNPERLQRTEVSSHPGQGAANIGPRLTADNVSLRSSTPWSA